MIVGIFIVVIFDVLFYACKRSNLVSSQNSSQKKRLKNYVIEEYIFYVYGYLGKICAIDSWLDSDSMRLIVKFDLFKIQVPAKRKFTVPFLYGILVSPKILKVPKT